MPRTSDKAAVKGRAEKRPQFYDEFDDDEIHTMQALTGFKRQNGTDYYLVKWEGYSDAEQTWEPSCNILRPTPEILAQMELLREKYFEKARKKKRARDAQASSSRDAESDRHEARGKIESVIRHEGKHDEVNNIAKHMTVGLPVNRDDESEQPLVTALNRVAGLKTPPQDDNERLSRKRRQSSVTLSADQSIHSRARQSRRRIEENSVASPTDNHEVHDNEIVNRYSSNSEIGESSSKQDREIVLEKIKILSFVVHKSHLQSNGLKAMSTGPAGLELVDNPKISVQLIIRKGEDESKEIYSLDYVRSKYPIDLLDFMLAQVQYYRPIAATGQ